MPIILARNFEGSPATDFAGEVRKRAAAASGTGEYDFVYIVPTRRRVRELQRELVTEVSFGRLPVFTLELFAHEIFLAMSTGRRVISPSMQGMIVGQILSDGEFKFFRYASFRPGTKKGIAPIGTIKRIVDQINYLEENGITPADYRTMVSAAGESERLKLEEFSEIYSGYVARLGNAMVDPAGIVSLVDEGLSRSPDVMEKSLPRASTVFVEGFYSFKKPELDFLRLVSSEKRFSFLVKLDCNESNGNLFRTMISTSRDLAQRGFKRLEPGGKGGSRVTAGEYLAANLFADDPPADRADLKDSIFVAGVRDSLREAEFVAERIKEIVDRQPGQKLDRICVASYLPQNYSPVFREVFRKYRIPANITDRYSLESNGIVNAVLSFVDIKAADYERVTLMRALTNRMIRVTDEFDAGKTGSIVYNAARICRFERGLDLFRNSIDARVEFLKKIGGTDPDNDFARAERDIETLKSARRILEAIERKLAGFGAEMSPEEFRSGMKALVSGLGIHGNIVRVDARRISAELIERDARALSSFFDVLDEVAGVETERGSVKLPVPIWLENLRSALSLTRYNIRQKYGYGVYVTSLEEIRGLEFDYLFIVGLNEGELPSKYRPEIFLPLKSQEENRNTEPYLQRHLFYQALSSVRKRLYLIHPVQREEVHLVRSSFIDAVAGIAEVTVVDDAADSRTRNIYNAHQLVEAGSWLLREGKTPAADIPGNLFPPNVERCMKAEMPRYRDETESEFTGVITDPSLVADLNAKLEERVFSAAQLESLSRCGFQFFAGRVLQISDIPDVETSLNAVERGAVLHRILYGFYSELAKRGELQSAGRNLELLLSVAREVLDSLGIGPEGSFGRDLFEIERESILGTPDVPGTLQLFLAKVQSKLSEYGFNPRQFEVGFGMEGGDGNSSAGPAVIGGVPVRGKIDRIDSSIDGQTIFDYKTSSRNAAHQDVVRDGLNPQLLIYLNALDRLIEASGTSDRAAGAAFISINRDRLTRAKDGSELIEFIVRDEDGRLMYNKNYGSARRMPAAAGYPETMDDLLQRTESFVKTKVDSAKSGRFNLTKFLPERVCTYCPYSEACRIALTGEGLGE